MSNSMSYGLSCPWQRICNRLDSFATHDVGMEQLDQLPNPQDDSPRGARATLTNSTGSDVGAPGVSGGSEGPTVSGTMTISEAAALLGVGRTLAYEVAAREGELAGVPVIRVGRRLLIPHARLLAVLGLETEAQLSDDTK